MTRTLEHRTASPRPTHTPHLIEAEIRILGELAGGSTLDTAARRLGIGPRTLRRRVRAACDRLNVNTPIEAMVWAAKRGLI